MAAATIFIIDDEPAVRDSLTMMLEQEGLNVIAYDNAPAFLAAYQEEILGCAIVDIRMPDMDGLTLQKEMLARNILLPIIFLTGHGDIPMSVTAMKAGAADFLTKPVSREKLMNTVRPALRESDKRLTKAACIEESLTLLNSLTEREREVMLLAIDGFSNKEIARRLDISHRTVEIHKSKIMHKTGAINLLDLAAIAREAGF